MRVKVKKKFIDKYSKQLVPIGTVLEISQERADEIKKVDSELIEILKEKKTTTKSK